MISTVGCDNEGNIYNINADTAAARIASALGAESLISMTDTVGLLRDKDDPSSLIPVVRASRSAAAHPRWHHFRRHDPQDRVLH